ncbi:MAG TPA: hypothetical protein VMS64_29640 [Candidatus Methylomirabilis sp.]|nr:hypothetical protein [Candidatus Methylomirabilis sp.]
MGTGRSTRARIIPLSGIAPRFVAYEGLVAAAVVLLGSVLAFAGLTDTGIHPPPATGAFAYNSFAPSLSPGTAYVDPVFGETVRRLSADHGYDDIYARNMWWDASETRYLHRTNGVPGKADNWDVIDIATGTVTHTGIPFGTFAFDGGFDPVNADVLYYLVQDRGDGHGEIHQVTLKPGGAWSDVVYFTAPGALSELGGTLNWLDASGRYMVVRYGAEPSVHLYDRQNLSAGPYANPIDGRNYIDTGAYIGLSPDGQFLVGFDGRAVGYSGVGQGVSWKLDHTNRAIAAGPTIFWSLCGDHGSFLSASDGRNYMVTNDCYSQAGVWRVDITNNAVGLNEAQQQVLPNNKLLLGYPSWNDGNHMSTVARGALRDWAFVSTEDGTDTFNGGVTNWHAYRQEIIAINVLTGETRRLAHHRSRSVDSQYYYQPRLSASWGGAYVGWASNFNQPGAVDIYAIPFGASATVGPVSAPRSKTFTVPPCRVLDTRVSNPAGRVAAGATRSILLKGDLTKGGTVNQGGAPTCGVPNAATGAYANVVAVNAAGPGFVTV